MNPLEALGDHCRIPSIKVPFAAQSRGDSVVSALKINSNAKTYELNADPFLRITRKRILFP